ncbi:hypothetical protein [Acidiferrobacter thiooxydans]|jgi:hypothetical protein|uniref:Uncharacterized protein n=1 Tax=Acidiferrobacter thiooxydans TaxID=163359 RepID=A0A1C2FZF6_9GAMM|nr:hypothetical protein [Acidiferrobacter thiooxydans]RCN55940.1 hypothetical protein C4900_08565 [Acidiferrobacter thiooxydans]UEN98801.1 hypothetical protein A9R16_010185 [Acidiferrobacter thiooxydans]
MSNLEDKLSASLQTQRRRPGTKTGDRDKVGPAGGAEHAKDRETHVDEVDLNAGGGRGVNPPRVWPD